MEGTVVLNPGLGVGHLVPMVELAKLFLQHGLAVTIVVIESPVKSPDFAAVVARASASNPSITFHVLRTPDADADAPAAASVDDGGGACGANHPFVRMFEFVCAVNAPLRDFLRSLPSVRALVLDMFCVDALDVAAELGIPSYFFSASGAGDAAVFIHLPAMQAKINANLGEIDTPISFPGAPPFKPTELPKEAHYRNNEPYKKFLYVFGRFPEANGILINTYESLEARAVRALKDGLCTPGRPTPPVYCIGPLVSGGGERKHECLEWLDAQPEQSVVFLCFGSLGTFSKQQLEEIAVGLERSGQRFLWVVRTPNSDIPNIVYNPLPEPDLDELLPEGFLERTKNVGFVAKVWVPQVEVLRHKATGAFVTHCGWNSTLEGITAGQPLVCWPLYAEQKVNKVFIVEEMRVGVAVEGYDKEEVVKAEEVEAKVRLVMESDGGRALRERAAAEKERAAEALKEGGSSRVAFVEFLRDLESARGAARA